MVAQGNGQTGAGGRAPLSAILFILFSMELAGRMAVQLALDSRGVPLFVVSMSTTMCWVGSLIGGVLWGRLSDKHDARWLLPGVILGATASIGILAMGLPTSAVLSMSFIRLLALSGSMPIAMAMISRGASLGRRGRDLSGLSSSRSIGGVVGLMAGGLLLQSTGFHGTFTVLAAWSSLALVLAILSYRTWGIALARTPARRLPRPRIAVHRLLWATTLRQMAIVGTSSLIFVYMQKLSIRADWMGGISALNPAMQVLAFLLFGRWADRFGRRRIFLFGFVLSSVAPMIYALASNTAHMAIGFLIHGTAFGAQYIGSAAYIGDVTPRGSQGMMFGLYQASFALGGIAGPLLSGAIATHVGLRPMLWAMAAIAILGALLASTQPVHRAEVQDPPPA